MKTTITINGITNEIELTEEQAKLFEEKKVTGWEMATPLSKFYVIDSDLNVIDFYAHNTEEDDASYEVGNYFSTEAKAKQMADRISLMFRMQRWADINCPDVEWDGINRHWFIPYRDDLYTDFSFGIRRTFEVYFGTKEGALQAIEIFGEEIKRVLGV